MKYISKENLRNCFFQTASIEYLQAPQQVCSAHCVPVHNKLGHLRLLSLLNFGTNVSGHLQWKEELITTFFERSGRGLKLPDQETSPCPLSSRPRFDHSFQGTSHPSWSVTWTKIHRGAFQKSSHLSPFFKGDLSLSPLLIGLLSLFGDLSRFAGDLDLSRFSPMFGGTFWKWQ